MTIFQVQIIGLRPVETFRFKTDCNRAELQDMCDYLDDMWQKHRGESLYEYFKKASERVPDRECRRLAFEMFEAYADGLDKHRKQRAEQERQERQREKEERPARVKEQQRHERKRERERHPQASPQEDQEQYANDRYSGSSTLDPRYSHDPYLSSQYANDPNPGSSTLDPRYSHDPYLSGQYPNDQYSGFPQPDPRYSHDPYINGQYARAMGEGARQTNEQYATDQEQQRERDKADASNTAPTRRATQGKPMVMSRPKSGKSGKKVESREDHDKPAGKKQSQPRGSITTQTFASGNKRHTFMF